MTLVDRYTFFREHAGYVVGQSAVCALALARAEKRAEEIGLVCMWRDEIEPWDGDCEPPKYCLWGCVWHQLVPGDRRPLASLGMVGVNSIRDPYLRVCSAELFAEALERLDADNDREATREAEFLASRATYAVVEA